MPLALAAFSLGAFNGLPFWLSNAVACTLACLWVAARPAPSLHGDTPGAPDWLAALWALLVGAALASTLVNFTALTVVNFFLGYATPLLLYVVARTCRLLPREIRWIVMGLTLGLLLRFSYGLLVFAQTFGIPEHPVAVFFMRDAVQSSAYVEATFGNTGNTASLIAVSLPVLLFSTVLLRFGAISRIVCALAIGVLLANTLITGSRGVLLFTVIAAALVLCPWANRHRILSVIGVGAVILLAQNGLARLSPVGEVDATVLFDYLTLQSENDESAFERRESIRQGLQAFADHPLGVGPNRSAEINQYSVPHQLALNQASDIGWLALPLWIAIAGVITWRFIADFWGYCRGSRRHRIVFSIGAFVWLAYGMTLNIVTTVGTCISWIGLLALFGGLSRNPSLQAEPVPQASHPRRKRRRIDLAPEKRTP